MKWIWRLLVSVGIGAILLGMVGIREELMMRLFPRAVLSKAVVQCVQQLEERFSQSPVQSFIKLLNGEDCHHIDLKLDTQNSLAGIMHWSMILHTQSGPNRIRAEGNVSTGNGTIGLDIYLDEKIAAVSSESLTEGSYYGITYDTFRSDIRSFELISLVAGEDHLTQLETSVQKLQNFMEDSESIPYISLEDIQRILLAVLALKPNVETGAGEESTIFFRISGPELAASVKPYLNQIPPILLPVIQGMEEEANSWLEIGFDLVKGTLTRIETEIDIPGQRFSCALEPGGSRQTPLTLEIESQTQAHTVQASMVHTSSSEETHYQEAIQLNYGNNGTQNTISADYTWNLSSGDMLMDILHNGKESRIRLNVREEGESFTITTREWDVLIGAITGKDGANPGICTVTLSPGDPVGTIPEYINMDQWTFEDLILLVTSLGKLVGFQIA